MRGDRARRCKRDTAVFTQSNYRSFRSRFLNTVPTHWSQIADSAASEELFISALLVLLRDADPGIFLFENTHASLISRRSLGADATHAAVFE